MWTAVSCPRRVRGASHADFPSRAWAPKAATQRMERGRHQGAGSSGASTLGQEFVRDPVALGQLVRLLLDVLPVKRARTLTEYAYLRQTGRTNNAGRGG